MSKSLEKNQKDEIEIEWEIESRKHKEQSNAFYIITLSITLMLLIFSVWQKDFLFGVFIILASGTILFLSAQPPEKYKFKLSKNGLTIFEGGRETFYPYRRFSHFDIYEFHPQDHELFMVFKEKYRPILRIRIYLSDREKIKDFLLNHLPQIETEPSFLDIFSKIVGI